MVLGTLVRVCYPSLGAVKYPLVPVLLGRRGGCSGVASIAWFRKAEATDPVTGDERGHETLLLFLGAKVLQRPNRVYRRQQLLKNRLSDFGLTHPMYRELCALIITPAVAQPVKLFPEIII